MRFRTRRFGNNEPHAAKKGAFTRLASSMHHDDRGYEFDVAEHGNNWWPP
jgi:hypothetical protein